MKILYHHRIASKDGMYVHVEELTNAMLEQGVDLHFVCPGFSHNAEFGSEGGFSAKLRARLPSAAYEVLELGYSLLIAIKLINAIIRFKPEVIYERYSLYQPAGVFVAKLFGIPLLLEVNAPLAEERKKHNRLRLYSLAKRIENYTWRNASWVLPVTNVLADYIRQSVAVEDRIRVVANGVNKKVFDRLPEVKVKAPGTEIVIGFTGFINPWHRLDLALEAMAAHKDKNIKFVCVGEGDVRKELVLQSERLGIADQVKFTGLVGRDKVFDYVSTFDIALQPAVTDYASPLKLFEYLAVGSLVIAPRTENILEVINDASAILFENDNLLDFSEKLSDAIANYNELYPIRVKAQQLIEGRGLTWQKNAERIVALARQSLAKG